MKRYILYLLPILIVKVAFGQTDDSDKTHTAFLLGMFNDYNGRLYVPHHPEESKIVTTFFYSELETARLFVDSMEAYFEDVHIIIKDDPSSLIKIYSEALSGCFNTYYNYKKTDMFFAEKTVETRDPSEEEFQIFIGKLKTKRLKKKTQKLYFLAGAFLRYGEITANGNYRFKYANSFSHFKTVKEFLESTGSKIINTNITQDNTPASQSVTFIPSQDLELLINK